MKLEEIEIKNFRSIQKCRVRISNITALVGENNSGKSSLLRALNAFFNYSEEAKDFFKGHHQYTSQSQPTIELVFGNIANNNTFASYTNGDKLIIRMRYSPRNQNRTLHYKSASRYESLDPTEIDKLKEFISFVLIPPNRELSKTQWAEATVFKELIEKYLEQATSNRDRISPKFLEAAKNLEKNALKKIANEISKFYVLRHNFDYQIKFDNDLNYKDFLKKINFFIQESSNSYELANCGTGIQSITIIALYRLLSMLQHKNIILGIEEPETNLHPQAQRELIYSVKKSIGQDNISQIILTTHAPVIIDQIKHDQVILFRKVNDSKRGFKSEINLIPDSFFDENRIDEFKYYQFHRYKNSDFFYAKFVIIVESKNDAEVFKYLLNKDGYDLETYGVSIIDLGGVTNLKYPLSIVRYLKLPFLVIVDKDYFLPYSNDKLESSRDNQGFPKYRYDYKNDCLVDDLVSSTRDKDNLLKLFKSNHSQGLDILEKYNIVCMKYSLEIDLIASNAATNLFYEHLNINVDEQTKNTLLVKRFNQIKKIENILPVLKDLDNKNLPHSYRRIKKIIIKHLKSDFG